MNDLPIRIVSINMYEAPTYQEQYYRPFTTDAGDTSIVNEIRERTHDGANMNAAAVSNAASRLIKPQTSVSGPAFIQNGWNERRLVFTMEIHSDSGFDNHTVVQYLSGFTDYVGVNPHSQSVDPQMRFFFNSVMSFRTVMHQQPGRGLVANRALQHAAHVITPSDHLMRQPSTLTNSYPSGGQFQDVDHLLRPQDLVNALQTESLMGYAANNGIGGETIDMSTCAAGGISLSRFNNGHTPAYLSSVLGAMFSVQAQMDTRQISDGENWSNLFGSLGEPTVTEFNILTTLMSRMGYGSFGGENSITWGELTSAFGGLTDFDQITRVYFTGQMMKKNQGPMLMGTENTEAMGGATTEVIAANMVVNSLPGIMARCMLAEFAFTATNEVVGSPEPYAVLPSGQPQTIAAGANFQQLVHVALDAIKHEVCPMISNGNQIPFFIQVHASLVRDTTVIVRIGGGPETPYVVPTWASAIFTPVAHSTQDNLQLMAHDINAVYGNVAGQSQAEADPYAMQYPGEQYGQQHGYQGPPSVSDSEPPSPDGIITAPYHFN